MNIANPSDLERLVSLFPNQEVYIVAGSDVVAHASAYQAPPAPYSIHAMNHIIFRRAGESAPVRGKDLSITGNVIQLQLPPHLEDISSSRIRENVDLNRDISNFIDPVIQDFIYQNGLYLRDSQDKPLLYAGDLEFSWEDHPDPDLLAAITAGQNDRDLVRSAIARQGDRVLLLRRTGAQEQLLGYVSYRFLSDSLLFDALGDSQLANRIRLRAAGSVLLITSLAAEEGVQNRDYCQLLLSELLSQALVQDCVYAVFRPHCGRLSPQLDTLLSCSGFVSPEGESPIRETDMHAPIVFIQNLETAIQDPLSHNLYVYLFIRRSHERMQLAIAGLYPGSLVLTLSSNIIHHRLLEKITAYNGFPPSPPSREPWGSACVFPSARCSAAGLSPTRSPRPSTLTRYTPPT